MKTSFSYWFSFLYFLVILFHLLGFDDQYVLLDLTSPFRWWEKSDFSTFGFSILSIYLLDLLLWYLIGLLIDGFIWLMSGKK